MMLKTKSVLRISPVTIQELQITAARTDENHALLKERGAFLV